MPRFNDPQPYRIVPMEQPKAPLTGKSKATIAIAAAVAIATPLAQQWEGYRGKAYLDPAKILTQCYGETRDIDPTRIYSKDECAAKLRARLAKDYAPKLLKCIPSFIDRHKAFGAALDASYNAGPVAVCKSPMARAFNAGDYRTGCKAFAGWYVTALNRQTGVRMKLPGLVNRRNAEVAVCEKEFA
jgi:lysozyme